MNRLTSLRWIAFTFIITDVSRADDQLKKRFQIIDEAEKNLTRNLPTLQNEIYKEILPILEKFDVSEGKIVYNRTAINLINQLEAAILRAINRTPYKDRVLDYLADFEKVKEINIKLQSSLNRIDVKSSNLTSIQRQAVKTTLNNLTGAGLDTNFVQPVKQVLFQHAVGGSSIAQTELALREVIKGNATKYGRLTRYLTQISRDAISGYDGEIQSRIANEFDLDGYSYEGSLIKTSAGQCAKWSEMGILKIADLQDEIDWAIANKGSSYNGYKISALVEGTTPATFAANRGHHGCRHAVTAVRIIN